MKKSLTASETRKVCDYFRKLSGAELQAAISLIYKDLPEGKSPRKYAMPSVQQGKIYSIDFADLSNNSLMLLTNYFDARAHQLGLTLPFKGKYADMKGTQQQTRKKNKKESNKLPIIQASPPSKRELENELSGLSALTGIKAVDLSNTSPAQAMEQGITTSLGKRSREEAGDTNVNRNSNNTSPDEQPPNKKSSKINNADDTNVKEDVPSNVEEEVAIEKGNDAESETSEPKKKPGRKKKIKNPDNDGDSNTSKTDDGDDKNDKKKKKKKKKKAYASSKEEEMVVEEEEEKVIPQEVSTEVTESEAPIVQKKKPGRKKKEKKSKETLKKKKEVETTEEAESAESTKSVELEVEAPIIEDQKELTLGEKKWAELCLSQIRGHSAADIFLYPVPATVPKYHEIIKNPMDLKTMADKIKSNKYKSKREFLQDLNLIVKNCKTFNKPGSQIYKIGMEFAEYIKEFTNPSAVRKDSGGGDGGRQSSGKKSTTPGGKKRKRLLGGDYAWCLMAIETLKTHALALPFYEPVSRSIPNYHKIVKRPMDFTTMTRKFERGNYDSKEACVKEIRQIFLNCKLFNTEGTQLYKDATSMERVLEQLLGNTSSRRGVATYSMPQDDYIYCTNILYTVRIHDLAGPFTAPIDPGFKEYFKVIKKPVDLLSMGRKLHEGKYTSKKHFLKDMEQIFVNCKLFNTPESELYEDGAKLEAYYRELLSVGENSGSSTDGATK